MNRALAVALVLLVLPAAVQQVDHAAGTHVPVPSGGGTTWWGPTQAGTGHHVRVGVTVQNPITDDVKTLTARVQLDLAELLPAAGWVHADGARTQLKGFHLDEDSVRVVRVSSLEGGNLVAQDASRSGHAKYVVPSLVLDRFVEGDDLRPGNPTSEPKLTVYWQAHDLAARGRGGDKQYFHVYLDTRTNGDHGPDGLEGSDVGAAKSLHWIGAAAEYYGVVPATGTNEDTPTVTLIGLHDGTRVRVELQQGTRFQEHPLDGLVELDEGETYSVGLGNAQEPVGFHLESEDEAPFVAFVTSTGFVPSLEGGLAGRTFVFEAGDAGTARSGLNLIAPDNVLTGTATPVVVTARGQDGSTRTFHLSDSVNDRPYTTALWSVGADGSCNPRPAGRDDVLRAGVRYTLTSPRDILVQVGGPMRAQQVPSLEGGAEGDDFGFLLDEAYHGNGCQRMMESRSWWAMSTDAATAFLDSPEQQARIEPPGDPAGDPRQTVPPAPAVAGPFSRDGGYANVPLFAHGDGGGDLRVFAGSQDNSRAVLSGALAHAGGLGASGLGPARVFAYHDETRLVVKTDHRVSGTRTTEEFLSAGSWLDLGDNPAGDLLDGWSIEADRPIVAYGLGARPGYLAGRPALADVTVGEAEYRGFLFDVASATGEEPQTQSTIPGESVTYRFVVENRARSHAGEPMADTVQVDVTSIDEGWTAVPDRTRVPLAPGATETVLLTVTPPKEAAARSIATIVLEATSEGNPGLTVSSSTVTNIKRSFDVGTWFDVVGTVKAQEKRAGQGTDLEFNVVVHNEGTVRDSIDLSLSGLEKAPGWEATIVRGKEREQVSSLVLEGGSQAIVQLAVTPPPELADGLLVLTLTATSASQPSAFDRVTALARIRAPAEIEATTDELAKLVRPGEEAAFPITVENSGAGSIELDLEAAADSPEGWGGTGFFVVHPTTGDRTAVDRLSIGPGEELGFLVNITAAKDALAGDMATLRALARPPGGEPAFEIAFRAVTEAVHDLEVTPSASPLLAPPGEAAPFKLTLVNNGNLDESLVLDAGYLPVGWDLTLPATPVQVPMEETVVVDLSLATPVGSPAGEDVVTLRFRSMDATKTTLDLPVVVPDANGLAVRVGKVGLGQPGRAVDLPIEVVNAGNAPATVTVRTPAGEPWAPRGVQPLELAPGASGQILTGWMVPPTAASGKSTHALEVVLTTADGDGSVRPVTAVVDVDRPQVRGQVDVPRQAPGGVMVVATLENVGNRTAYDVRVQLRAGERVLDEALVQVLEGGDTAVVSLLDGEGSSSLSVVLDPDDRVVEGNEADNVLPVTGEVQGAPGPGVLALLAGVLVAAWGRKRSRT